MVRADRSRGGGAADGNIARIRPRQHADGEAAAALRALIEDIVLTPEGGEVRIDVRGDLAGILTIALNKKPSAGVDGGREQAKLVAGAATLPTRCQEA